MVKKKETVKKVSSKKIVETKTKPSTEQTSGEKIYVYIVKVFDKDKNLLTTYPELTSKEIEKLKKTFKDGEYVRYMPIGAKEK